MNRRLLGFLLVVSVAVNVVAAFALASYLRETRRPRPGPAPGRPEPLALADLKSRYQLTDAQMDTMKALHEFRRDNLRPVRDRLDSLQAELLNLLQGPQLNEPRINTVMAGVVAAQETLETGAFQVLLRMRNALTAEQLPQLRELFNDLQRAGQRRSEGRRAGANGELRPGQMPATEPGAGQPPPTDNDQDQEGRQRPPAGVRRGPDGERGPRRTPPREPGPGQPPQDRPPKAGEPDSTR